MAVVQIPVGECDSLDYLQQAGMVCYKDTLFCPVDLEVADSSAFMRHLAGRCERVRVDKLLSFVSALDTKNLICRFEEHEKKRHSFDYAILSPCHIFKYREQPDLLNNLLFSQDSLTPRVARIQAWWRAWLRKRSRRLLPLLTGRLNADVLSFVGTLL